MAKAVVETQVKLDLQKSLINGLEKRESIQKQYDDFVNKLPELEKDLATKKFTKAQIEEFTSQKIKSFQQQINELDDEILKTTQKLNELGLK